MAWLTAVIFVASSCNCPLVSPNAVRVILKGPHWTQSTSRNDLWAAYVDPAQLESALLNLVVNARDALPDGGEITIVGHNRELCEGDPLLHEDMAAGDYVTIAVRDTGAGIPPEAIEHVFEPFFTTKDVDEGTGLGLSMVYGFVRQSGGNVTLDSAVGRGTTVTIGLPRSHAAAPAKPTQPEAAPQSGGGQLILVVEDPDLQDLTTLVIEGLGYHVCTASTARRSSPGPRSSRVSGITYARLRPRRRHSKCSSPGPR